jgi:N-methylhydantoinase A
MTTPSILRIAVDIGGTFTDTVLIAGDDRILATAKTLTTNDNPSTGAFAGVKRVVEQAGVQLSEVSGFIHGTTLATNALIERRGARVAGITTDGFRDILEIAYERRYSQYDIDLEKPDLIVPRARCFTVPERTSVNGPVIAPLDESKIEGLVAGLDACGAEAVAVCLLHSYANPFHEIRLRDLLRRLRPHLSISLSSEVSPEAREFERLCTTVANAYVQPLMSKYLIELAEGFKAEGLACPILMMTAGGGMTPLETAAAFPIRLVESGPAGGAILAARIAAACGAERVLSFDMGGTTAKLCLIDDYRPQTSRKFEIARADRFIKGSGMPVRIPVVEMVEIGAGGGSIAAVDGLGRITVGPESAGSDPGPAAFGKNGTRPTVTDADVVLGLIEPDTFAEGRLEVDTAAAARALAADVGGVLGLDELDAADAVGQIVDDSMASAARVHAAESGKDLGERTMIAFGGNGPLHATRVARRAGIGRIVIPPDPGVASAVGFLHAPISFEVVRSRYATLDTLDVDAINALFAALIGDAEKVVRAGAPDMPLVRWRKAFIRYRGQGHEIEIALPDRALEVDDVDHLRSTFEEEYRRQFARAVPGMVIEILNWSVRVSTPEGAVPPVPAQATRRVVEPRRTRTIKCDLTGRMRQAGVVERSDLSPGDSVSGPALIIEPQTTTFVSADFEAAVMGDGSLVLTRSENRGVPQ